MQQKRRELEDYAVSGQGAYLSKTYYNYALLECSYVVWDVFMSRQSLKGHKYTVGESHEALKWSLEHVKHHKAIKVLVTLEIWV